MSPLPFSRLLDALRAKGLPLGVREYIAYAELWQRLEGATAAELRGASAALLGTSAEEVAVVVATFDELYCAPAAAPAPVADPAQDLAARARRVRRSPVAWWTLAAVLVALAALGVWVAR